MVNEHDSVPPNAVCVLFLPLSPIRDGGGWVLHKYNVKTTNTGVKCQVMEVVEFYSGIQHSVARVEGVKTDLHTTLNL